MSFSIVDESETGFTWLQDELMERASHAFAVDGRVWLIDPVDDPEVADRIVSLGEPAGVLQLLDRHNRGCSPWSARFGIPVLQAWDSVGDAPFEVVPLYRGRWWKEAALWEPGSRTLVCAEAVGTATYYRAASERIGVHPFLRLLPPKHLRALAPDRILVGHGPALDADAAPALADTLRRSRRHAPSAWLAAVRTDRAARRNTANG
jgi:hypothetical protein